MVHKKDKRTMAEVVPSTCSVCVEIRSRCNLYANNTQFGYNLGTIEMQFKCNAYFYQTCKRSGSWEPSSRTFLKENPDIFQKLKILRKYIKICFDFEKIRFN